MDDEFKKVCEVYAGNPELQTAVSILSIFVPALGVADKLLSGLGSSIAMERIELLTSALEIRLGGVEEKIDRNESFYRSPEFVDLILRALELTVKSRSTNKIEEAATVLVCAAKKKDIPYSIEEYLRAIAELSEIELLVAKELFEMQKDTVYDGKGDFGWKDEVCWNELPSRFPQIDPDHLPFVLARIERTGLIAKNEVSTLDAIGGGPMPFHITKTFRFIMSYLDTGK